MNICDIVLFFIQRIPRYQVASRRCRYWKQLNQDLQVKISSLAPHSTLATKVQHLSSKFYAYKLVGEKWPGNNLYSLPGFCKDKYTILPEATDRPFSTKVSCQYKFDTTKGVDFSSCWWDINIDSPKFNFFFFFSAYSWLRE